MKMNDEKFIHGIGYPYPGVYLSDAMDNLAEMFEYATIDCKLSVDDAFDIFLDSGIGEAYSEGDYYYISGMQGHEVFKRACVKLYGIDYLDMPMVTSKPYPSEAYWLGMELAYYQFYRNITFKDIKDTGVPMADLEDMYYPYHEASFERAAIEFDRVLGFSRVNP